jgi:hypothetical protein
MATRNVTYASMIATDGAFITYGIYRAKLHYDLSRPAYVDLNRAKRVGTVRRRCNYYSFHFPYDGELAKMYYDMAEPYATPEWPAFSWDYEPEQESAT